MKLLLLIILVFSWNGFGQETLSLEAYLNIVRSYHPIIKTSYLKVEQAQNKILEKKGSFDPNLFAYQDQKYFDDVFYYSHFNGGVKYNTPIGLNITAGYKDNSGYYLNPEQNISAAGQWYASLELPLLKGLLTDERRMALKEAKILENLSLAEQRNIINYILFDAAVRYFKWRLDYVKVAAYEEALVLAENYLDAVTREAESGNKPFIDTVESFMQMQNWKIDLLDQEQKLIKSRIAMSAYLWDENGLGYVLRPEIKPTDSIILNESLIRLDASAIENHPEIAKYNVKEALLKNERRWISEQWKPTLNLKYTFLGQGSNTAPIFTQELSDYAWGLQFKFPLFLRKNRGAFLYNKNAMQINQFERDFKGFNINLKLEALIQQRQMIQTQMEAASAWERSSYQLLEAEQELFEIGESSIFMLNSRAKYYIKAYMKQLEIAFLYQSNYYEYLYEQRSLE